MPFRFRRNISLGKGLRLNFSKGGVSTSIGKKGATLNIGKRGIRPTVGIPGSGLSFTASQSKTNSSASGNSKATNTLVASIVLVVVLCLLAVCCVSFFFWNTGTITSTPTPLIPTKDIEAVIAMTSNAAIQQTRSASSPTPFITVTSLPTLTTFPTQTITVLLEPTATATIVFILPTNPPAGGGGSICPCGGDTLNCSDFSSHASAQACFNYCVSQGAGDIHKLDQNNDNDACESLN